MNIHTVLSVLGVEPKYVRTWKDPVLYTEYSSVHVEYLGFKLWFHLQNWPHFPPDLWITLLTPEEWGRLKSRAMLTHKAVWSIRNICNLSQVKIDEQVFRRNVLVALFS